MLLAYSLQNTEELYHSHKSLWIYSAFSRSLLNEMRWFLVLKMNGSKKKKMKKWEDGNNLLIRGYPKQAQSDFDEFVYRNVDTTSRIIWDTSTETNSYYHFTSRISVMNKKHITRWWWTISKTVLLPYCNSKQQILPFRSCGCYLKSIDSLRVRKTTAFLNSWWC